MSWTHTFALSALVLLSSCLTKDNPIVELPEDTKNPIQKTIDELPLVVCDPLDGGEQGAGSSSVDSNQGVKGRLFEGHVKINHFEDLVDPNTKDAIEGNSTLMDAQILMQNLDVPTRAFSEGFKIGEERYVLGSDGEILMEDFGIQFESRLALGDLEPGYYELALLSDDGSILKIDTENNVSDGVYDHTLLETNFVTPTRMSCANDLVRIDENTTLPFELSYFQGPRYHIALVILARKVKDLDASNELLITNPNSDQECGQKGNSRFFNSNNNSVPTQRFKDLLARDWKVLSDQNFRLPGEEDVNYCIEGTNIIIDRNNCFREDVKHSTAQEFEFLGDFDQVDFETISVAIDGEFVENESFNIDYLNERLQFSATPSDGDANLRVTYCLKEEVPFEEQTPESYFSYQIDENDPLTIHLNLLSKAQGDSTIESARYILNGGADTIELSDTSYKSSVSYTFGDPNFYNIELFVTDSEGRTESFSRVLDLTTDSHPPVVNFEVSQINTTEIFLDLNKSFAVQGYLEAGEIDFGDGTKRPIESLFETYTYASQGDYEVTVAMRDSFGNVSETSKQISVDHSFATHPPVADFYIDKLDFAGGFRFYFAESGSPNGEIVDFTWQLGDGEIASGEEAMHFYEPGIYDVTLRVEDELGLTDTQTQRIVVHGGEPFIANINCWSDGPEAFCDWSVLDSGKDIQQVSVDWGDGVQEDMDVFNPEYELYRQVGHTYSRNGDYEIEIGARNGNGDIVFEMISLKVSDGNGEHENLAPHASFRCENRGYMRAICYSSSFDSDGQVVKYEWDIGEGYFENESSIEFEFNSEEELHIKHRVTDNEQAQTEAQTSISPKPYPSPEVKISGWKERLDPNTEFQLEALILSPDEEIVDYTWYVNEELYSDTSTINLSFNERSVNTITIVVTNEWGKTDEHELPVISSLAPHAEISLDTEEGVIPFYVNASAQNSYSPYGDELTYSWTLGGEEYEGEEVSFNINEPGILMPTLTVADSLGASSSSSIEITSNIDKLYIYEEKEAIVIEAQKEYVFSPQVVADFEESELNFDVHTQSTMSYELDEKTGGLTLNPDLSHLGEHEFEIEVYVGEESFSRQFRFNVLEFQEIATVLSHELPADNVPYAFSFEEGHPLYGLSFSLPVDDERYGVEVRIREAVSPGGESYYRFDLSGKSEKPIEFSLPDENLFKKRVTSALASSSVNEVFKTVNLDVFNSFQTCPGIGQDMLKYSGDKVHNFYHVEEDVRGLVQHVGTGIKVYFQKSLLRTPEKIDKILGVMRSTDIYYDDTVEILFTGSERVFKDSKDLAKVDITSPRTIWVNTKSLATAPGVFEHTYWHEYRHIDQYDILGCNAASKGNLGRLKWLMENEAELYAVRKTGDIDTWLSLRKSKKGTKQTSLELISEGMTGGDYTDATFVDKVIHQGFLKQEKEDPSTNTGKEVFVNKLDYGDNSLMNGFLRVLQDMLMGIVKEPDSTKSFILESLIDKYGTPEVPSLNGVETIKVNAYAGEIRKASYAHEVVVETEPLTEDLQVGYFSLYEDPTNGGGYINYFIDSMVGVENYHHHRFENGKAYLRIPTFGGLGNRLTYFTMMNASPKEKDFNNKVYTYKAYKAFQVLSEGFTENGDDYHIEYSFAGTTDFLGRTVTKFWHSTYGSDTSAIGEMTYTALCDSSRVATISTQAFDTVFNRPYYLEQEVTIPKRTQGCD